MPSQDRRRRKGAGSRGVLRRGEGLFERRRGRAAWWSFFLCVCRDVKRSLSLSHREVEGRIWRSKRELAHSSRPRAFFSPFLSPSLRAAVKIAISTLDPIHRWMPRHRCSRRKAERNRQTQDNLLTAAQRLACRCESEAARGERRMTQRAAPPARGCKSRSGCPGGKKGRRRRRRAREGGGGARRRCCESPSGS